jgi:DNA-binding response OmpR family regulator
MLVKARKQLQKTAKIMITGFPSLASGVKALEWGADAYLIKPIQPMELLSVIEDKL